MKQFQPTTTVMWSEVQKLRRKKYFTLAAILALMGAFFITKAVLESNQKNKLTEVFVATKTLEAPQTLADENIVSKLMPMQFVPKNIITQKTDLIGKTLTRKINENEIFVHDDISQIIDPNSLTAFMPQGSKSLIIPENWLESPMPDMTEGDTINIIISPATRNIHETKIIASNIRIIRTSQNSRAQGNYIAVLISENDAKNIMYAHSLKIPMNIIINSRE